MSYAVKTNSAIAPKQVKALYIDDDHVDGHLFERLIKRLENYNVDLTILTSVEQASQKIKGENFDLFFVDFWLGSQTSLDFIQQLGGRLHGVPVIMVTSLSIPDIRNQALTAGASAVLSKDDLSAKSIETAIEVSFQMAHQNEEISERGRFALTGARSDQEDYALIVASELESGVETLEHLLFEGDGIQNEKQYDAALIIAGIKSTLAANVAAHVRTLRNAHALSETVNVGEVIDGAMAMWDAQAKQAGVSCVGLALDLPISIKTDYALFRMMASHLYRQAIIRSNPGAKLVWDCEFYDDVFLLSIRCSDGQLQEQDIVHLPGHICRHSPSARSLQIAELLAQKLGGDLMVDGDGSEFCLSVEVQNSAALRI